MNEDYTKLGGDMIINPFDLMGIKDARARLGGISSLNTFHEFTMVKKHVPFLKTLRYVLVLYSKDSFLNVKPLRPIEERQKKAAMISGFTKARDGRFHQQVRMSLFELGAEEIFNFVFDYLVYQKNFLWSEICTLEQQLLENQRIRMSNMEGMKMSELEKKGKLTIQWKEWHDTYLEYLNEFYGDFQEVRDGYDIHKAGLVTIEVFARER